MKNPQNENNPEKVVFTTRRFVNENGQTLAASLLVTEGGKLITTSPEFTREGQLKFTGIRPGNKEF